MGERCYRVFLDRKPWTEAHENCTVDGAELVSLQTRDEETLLRNYLNETFGKYVHFISVLMEWETT